MIIEIMYNTNLDRRAAIVCSHIAREGALILKAIRDEPELPEDSGWQFLCAKSEEEDPDKAQIWLVCEVVESEPSLGDYMDLPPRVVVTRAGAGKLWEVSGNEPT